MARITKSKRIYDLDPEPTEGLEDKVRFFMPDEDRLGEALSVIYLERDGWRWLGEPDTITITIEPGDKLNDPVTQEQRRAAGVRVDVKATRRDTL